MTSLNPKKNNRNISMRNRIKMKHFFTKSESINLTICPKFSYHF